MKQVRQDTLLAVTILENQVETEVASKLKVHHKGMKLGMALKLYLSDFIYCERENLPEEKRTAINLLFSEYQNFIDLKMIKLSGIQAYALKTLMFEINNPGNLGIASKAMFSSLYGLLLFANEYEYFGYFQSKTIVHVIKMTLAKKRNFPTRYIGVGYKDKGTTKIESYDGFHSWQEITATWKASMNERISAGSYRVGKEVKVLPQFLSVDISEDFFGNPIRLHLELVELTTGLAWRELHNNRADRDKILHTVPRMKAFGNNRFFPSIDNKGRFNYLYEKKWLLKT